MLNTLSYGQRSKLTLLQVGNRATIQRLSRWLAQVKIQTSQMINGFFAKLLDVTQRAMWRVAMVFTFLVGGVGLGYAQVTLTIPTDDIFTSINSWIATFAPIVAIGIGIAAAIAILTFVGNEIIRAFRGRR